MVIKPLIELDGKTFEHIAELKNRLGLTPYILDRMCEEHGIKMIKVGLRKYFDRDAITRAITGNA